MRTFVACALMAASACMANGQPVQWRVEDGGNGHWYEVVVTAGDISWNDSKLQAQARGGLLSSLESSSEALWVLSIATNPLAWPSRIGPWVGGYQDRTSSSYSEPSGGWKWVSGAPFAFSNWGGLEPNNSFGAEDFLNIITNDCSNRPAGRFYNDLRGSFGPINSCERMPNSYIIEWSADCNNDGIVDKGQILSGQLPDANNNGIPDSGVVITSQPTSLNLAAGVPVLFSVETSTPTGCTLPTSYMWQRRNPLVTDDNAPNAWIDLAGVSGFVNATTSSLGIPRPTPGMATGFRCRISNPCGCEGGTLYSNTVNFTLACPSDFNADGSVDGDDVIQFFQNWDSGC